MFENREDMAAIIVAVLLQDATMLQSISYAGGANTAGGDRLILRNGRNTSGSFRPDNGVVTVSGRRITLTDVEPIDVKSFAEFTVTTPNSSGILTFTGTGIDAIQLAGTSGALALPPVTFVDRPEWFGAHQLDGQHA